MKLSVVTTLYCSEQYIDEFFSRTIKSIEQIKEIGDSYEVIFVDDGSPDSSLQKVIELSKKNDNIKAIELSRNHGHHRAMMIGMEHASADIIFLTDSDLEEPPESLVPYWIEMHKSNVDVVYGVQNNKPGGLLRKSLSQAFYKVFNFLSYIQIPENELVSRLMKKNYVTTLLQYQERELFIPGIWIDAGFKRKPLITKKYFDGNSSYSLKRRVTMAVDAVTSFSTKPLNYIFYLGAAISILAVLFAIYLAFRKLFFGVTTNGWTSILVSLYVLGGIIIFCIGTIGLYLSRIFLEVKARPRSIIRNIYHNGKEND